MSVILLISLMAPKSRGDMKVYIYKIKFHGSTHFGDTGIDLENVCEWINSDTLFSALMNALCTTEGQDAVTDFLNSFLGNPSFLISSLFIYNGNNCYLPRPLSDSNVNSELKKEMGKELKKLKWLNAEGFQKWTSNRELSEEDINSMKLAQEEYKKAFTVEIRPRVTLDRITQNSSIYHTGYVYYEENAGLYGMVAFADLSSVDYFKRLLKSVGEIGLGGEKTYGCGMFEITDYREVSGTFKDIFETESVRVTLLSLYHPSANELNAIGDNLVAYDTFRKRGWISTGRYALPLKRKSIGFITEGSVLQKQPRGCVADVTPDNIPPDMLSHKVYRYGYAFTAPFRRLT